MPPPAPRPPRRGGSSGGGGGGAAAAAASSSTATSGSTSSTATTACAALPPAPAPAAPPATWQGSLLHRRGGGVAELASLAVQLPGSYLPQMPAALSATDLLPRHAAPLGDHVVCRCSLLAATTPRQLEALAALARARLVAVVPLQLCELLVVPYLDGRGAARVVAFLRVFGGAGGAAAAPARGARA
jgi:hypothetical protein